MLKKGVSLVFSPYHISCKENIKIPKLLLPELEFIIKHSCQKRDVFYTNLIIYQFESLLNDPEVYFYLIIDHSQFLERMRTGINQYHGTEFHKQVNSNHETTELREEDFESVTFNWEIPTSLNACIEYLCTAG